MRGGPAEAKLHPSCRMRIRTWSVAMPATARPVPGGCSRFLRRLAATARPGQWCRRLAVHGHLHLWRGRL